MHVIETRLSDRKATLAGIVHFIHRNLAEGRLDRVEVRHSAEALVPLSPQQARDKISDLLRESGSGDAAVSVRPHQGALDNASGDFVVRIFPSRQPEPAGPAEPRGLRGLLAWLFPRLFGRAQATPADVGEASQPAVRPTARPEAVRVLRDAVGRAAAAMGKQVLVTGAHITVRSAALNATLQPIVPGDAASIGDMLAGRGLSLAPSFGVRYTFEPVDEMTGTTLAGTTDINVQLLVGGNVAKSHGERIDPLPAPYPNPMESIFHARPHR